MDVVEEGGHCGVRGRSCCEGRGRGHCGMRGGTLLWEGKTML